jgi:hypothetical protein
MTERRGIPTKYRSVNFRSRLEAKYAALFDLLGWRWIAQWGDWQR